MTPCHSPSRYSIPFALLRSLTDIPLFESSLERAQNCLASVGPDESSGSHGSQLVPAGRCPLAAFTKHMRAAVTTALCHSSLVPTPPGDFLRKSMVSFCHTNFRSFPHKNLISFFSFSEVLSQYSFYVSGTSCPSVCPSSINTMDHTVFR